MWQWYIHIYVTKRKKKGVWVGMVGGEANLFIKINEQTNKIQLIVLELFRKQDKRIKLREILNHKTL